VHGLVLHCGEYCAHAFDCRVALVYFFKADVQKSQMHGAVVSHHQEAFRDSRRDQPNVGWCEAYVELIELPEGQSRPHAYRLVKACCQKRNAILHELNASDGLHVALVLVDVRWLAC
jgi:hypothetical protein